MNLNTAMGRRKDDELTRLYPSGAGDNLTGYSNGRGTGSSNVVPSSTTDGEETDDRRAAMHDDDIRKAAVFGALDGVLTSFAIVAGAAGGGLGTQAILILGVSSIFADGLSMGLGEYLSSKALNEYIDIERKREEWELTHHRQGEIDQMVALYTRRGMAREDAQEVLTRLSKYDQLFVNVMMAEELGLSPYGTPSDEGGSICEGLVTFVSFALSGVLPLLVYALSPLFSGEEPVSQGMLFVWACVITASALVLIGVVKAELPGLSTKRFVGWSCSSSPLLVADVVDPLGLVASFHVLAPSEQDLRVPCLPERTPGSVLKTLLSSESSSGVVRRAASRSTRANESAAPVLVMDCRDGLTLAEHAAAMGEQIQKYPEDWEKRRDALVVMRQVIEETVNAGQVGTAVFNAEVWRLLKEPIKQTLNELRSAIVKDACQLLEVLSTASGNLMSALVRDVLSVLLQLVANGNSVIVAHVDSCLKHMIKHTRFPRQLKDIEYRLKNTRSKDMRVSIASYLLLMLQTWPPASMEKEISYLETMIEMLLSDASSQARTDARASFAIFRVHWPKKAEKILEDADPRTAKILNSELASSAGADLVGTSGGTSVGMSPSSTGGGGGGGSVVSSARPSPKSQMAPTQGQLGKGFNRRTPPVSGQSLRVAAEGGSTGGNGLPPGTPNSGIARRRSGDSVSPSQKVHLHPSSFSSTPPPSASSPSQAEMSRKASAARRMSGLPPSLGGVAGGGNFGASGTLSASSSTSSTLSSAAKARRKKARPLLPTTPNNGGGNLPMKSASPHGLSRGKGNITSPLSASGGGFVSGGRGGAGGPIDKLSDASGVMALAEGDKVRLKGASERRATVRYVGETQFATGVWVGVELDEGEEPPGNNNGMVNGLVYFVCPPARGIFLRPDMVSLDESTETSLDPEAKGSVFSMEGARESVNAVSARLTAGNGDVERLQRMASSADDAARRAGAELLGCHKVFVKEAIESMYDEMNVIPGLERIVDSDGDVPPERLRFYREVLESAVESREAAAARLRAQILGIARRYPSLFNTDSSASASHSVPLLPNLAQGVGNGGEAETDGGKVSNVEPDGKESVDRKLFAAEQEETEGAEQEKLGSGLGGDGEDSAAPAAVGDSAPLPVPPCSGGEDTAESHSPPSAPLEEGNKEEVDQCTGDAGESGESGDAGESGDSTVVETGAVQNGTGGDGGAEEATEDKEDGAAAPEGDLGAVEETAEDA